MNSEIVLRSSSPRRKEILKFLGFDFQVSPSSISEEYLENETPLDYLQRVTLEKLGEKTIKDSFLYISADTIVVYNQRIFPKPSTPEINFEFLQILNGKTHSVFSGLGINYKGATYFSFEETKVKFRKLEDFEIEEYIQTCNPYDKAGGYGIQDEKSPVEKITGSYWNVVGFPLRSFFSYHYLWRDFLIKQ
ncbi:MAG: septum formation protein Maf [Spirochaetia bacterium]|nr:septum formation protein Maf [Spirochaetia bacterium]